ncbi:hypothetical protein Tco_0876713 [Tanacetum coccineum]|uniref:Uncharacterized protein n=1 Tax=Tanacetum coccineum TaxID=301880 RepID=A0ABQ5BVS4_9ASTR
MRAGSSFTPCAWFDPEWTFSHDRWVGENGMEVSNIEWLWRDEVMSEERCAFCEGFGGFMIAIGKARSFHPSSSYRANSSMVAQAFSTLLSRSLPQADWSMKETLLDVVGTSGCHYGVLQPLLVERIEQGNE